MLRIITLIGAGGDRLTPQEVQMIFDALIETHDHFATQPQQPIFWHRSQANEIWNWMN